MQKIPDISRTYMSFDNWLPYVFATILIDVEKNSSNGFDEIDWYNMVIEHGIVFG